MKRFQEPVSPALLAGIGGGLLGVFLVDVATPLGMSEWVVYLLPVAMTLLTWRPRTSLLVALLASVLLVAGYYASPPNLHPGIAAFNRSLGLITIGVLAAICYGAVRRKLVVRRQEWLQQGQTLVGERIVGERRMEELGEKTLDAIAEYTGASVGVMYVQDGDDFARVAARAVPPGTTTPERLRSGDGLLGQAARDGEVTIVDDVPDGYLQYGSALGRSKPAHLMFVPAKADGSVNALVELGFAQEVGEADAEFARLIAPAVGAAVKAARYRTRLQELLAETQRQGQELQAQTEELRVSNEELEEQGRALRESQARLEAQQAELEQTNTQLEEQAQLLAAQKADLSRAKAYLESQAQDLDRASRYKSEFLANMSHELRTPLNSSLILSKLLADNPTGNLTEEQVKFASTIHTSGNDLLTLINDILDLAKVEAGRVEVEPEEADVDALLGAVADVVRPLAESKQLSLRVDRSPDAPAKLVTDQGRLEQILRNLLGNAVKFTDEGEVAVEVRPAGAGRVSLAVRDTGPGIAEDQREVIFEAFRQADGTTNRKHGGTGLGLSISRQLARLLGGELRVDSAVGKGSTFTLTLPTVLKATSPGPLPPPSMASGDAVEAPAEARPSPAKRRPPTSAPTDDDRGSLTGDDRTILIVEDDPAFAGILRDLAREQGFRCLLADTAEEALALAAQHRPGAVLLDVGLPDQSGLSVLDRLKRDARTRHIPVHVVSAADYSETALALGAVGYMLKPVRREQLVEAMEGLQARLAQRLRRVLIVEDDEAQLDSLRSLLASAEVETVGASSAAACLEQLGQHTFDCMVLDLSLPDASGFSLLETLSREDRYSFPPVIVYTGRDLSAAEEQRLRRYSKSIIIKGAKSPERLLDEVTLFLHQVVSELPAEQQEMLKKAHSRESALEGRRVLIVEDDVRNVFALTSVLEPRGVTTRIARNGREALEVLAESPREIDLVLMDLMMPEMDGLTATREIRKRPELADLPVIALTAKAMKGDQQACLDAGANDYMSKPLDVDKLLSLVRVWMPR